MTDRMIRDTSILTRNRPIIDNWRTVAGGGADFKSIQAAIDYAAPRASAVNPWGVFVYPGVYNESIVGADNVHLVGASRVASVITGTVDFGNTNASIDRILIQHVVQQDNTIIVQMGSSVIFNASVVGIVTANYNVIGVDWDCAPGASCGGDGVGVYILDTGTTDANLCCICFDGDGSALLFGSAIEINCNRATSGNHVGIRIASEGIFGGFGNRIYAAHSNPGFSGNFCFRRVENNPSPLTMAGSFFQARGAGGGEAIAFCCDSGGKAARVNEDTASVNIDGYATEYMDDTATDDAQFIRVVSSNKAFPSKNGGLVAITPFDENKTGVRNYTGSGNYYSLSGTTFTVLRPGIGYIKSIPTVWLGNQAATIVANEKNDIGFDLNGTIFRTDTVNADLYKSNMPVYAIMYDGTNAVVKRESHPYEYPTPVSLWAHKNFGVRIGLQGADPQRVATGTGAAAGDRQIKIVGEGTVDDHGIEGIIPDTAGSPITMQCWYLNGIGNWMRFSSSTEVPMFYVLANVVTAIPTNSYGLLLVEIVLDDGNTATPTYIVRLANSIFGNENDANAAKNVEKLTEGTYFVLPTKEYLNIEPARFAYVVIRNVVAGGHIVSLERIKKA